MTKQVQDLTDLELKSIGYETLMALEQNRINLQTIQTELHKRANTVTEEIINPIISKKK